MKKLLVLTLGLCLLGLVSTNAEEKKNLENKDKQEIPAKVLEKFDKNKDGKLDAEEKAAMKKENEEHRKEMLKKFDKNGDGKLDETERAAAKEAGEKHHKKENKEKK